MSDSVTNCENRSVFAEAAKNDHGFWFFMFIVWSIAVHVISFNSGFEGGEKVGEGRVRDKAFTSAMICGMWVGPEPKTSDFGCDQLHEIARGDK